MLPLYSATFNGFILQVAVQLLSSHVNFNINEIFFAVVSLRLFFVAGEGVVKDECHSSPSHLWRPHLQIPFNNL